LIRQPPREGQQLPLSMHHFQNNMNRMAAYHCKMTDSTLVHKNAVQNILYCCCKTSCYTSWCECQKS